jgi:hypothetical protein
MNSGKRDVVNNQRLCSAKFESFLPHPSAPVSDEEIAQNQDDEA